MLPFALRRTANVSLSRLCLDVAIEGFSVSWKNGMHSLADAAADEDEDRVRSERENRNSEREKRDRQDEVSRERRDENARGITKSCYHRSLSSITNSKSSSSRCMLHRADTRQGFSGLYDGNARRRDNLCPRIRLFLDSPIYYSNYCCTLGFPFLSHGRIMNYSADP